jgi:hypothetical protein
MTGLHIFARVVSLLLHPVFMPIAGFYLMLNSDTEVRDLTQERVRDGIFLLLGVLVIAPVVSTVILYSFRFIRDPELKNPKERIAPFLTTTLFYIMAYVMLLKGKNYMHPIIFSSYSAAVFSMAVGLVITFRYTISMHTMGVAGVAGMLYALVVTVFYGDFAMIALVVFLTGLVGTARMIRGVHSLDQVVAGALLGAVSQYLFIVNHWAF